MEDHWSSHCLPALSQSPSEIGACMLVNLAHCHCEFISFFCPGIPEPENTAPNIFERGCCARVWAVGLVKCVVDFVRSSAGTEIRTNWERRKKKKKLAVRERELEREPVRLILKYPVGQFFFFCSVFAQSTQKKATFFDNLHRNNKSFQFHLCYYQHS